MADLMTNYQHVIDVIEIKMGTKGAYEFEVDGKLLFSKQTLQKRHAQEDEILQLFKEHVGPDVTRYNED